VRVLVADDNADLRAMLRLSLELAGDFEVVAETADGPTTLALTDALQPDVVLLDLRMPGDVPDLVARLCAADVGVVVLTGWLVAEDRERMLAGGASAYVVKAPDLLATLVPAIRNAAPSRVGVDAER
jgi:DNA-binding NarL/FixJ family response regulator